MKNLILNALAKWSPPFRQDGHPYTPSSSERGESFYEGSWKMPCLPIFLRNNTALSLHSSILLANELERPVLEPKRNILTVWVLDINHLSVAFEFSITELSYLRSSYYSTSIFSELCILMAEQISWFQSRKTHSLYQLPSAVAIADRKLNHWAWDVAARAD